MSCLLQEIAEQPDVLIRTSEKMARNIELIDMVVRKIKSGDFSHIIITGMGASYYSCYPLWLKLSNLGLPVSLWDTSELINFAPNCIHPSTLLIVVSQSGESAEIKRLLALENSPGFRVGVTNSKNGSLSRWSDLLIELSAGEEKSVSTKTYLASLAVLHLLGCKISGGNFEAEIYKLYTLADQMRVYLNIQIDQFKEMVNFINPAKTIAFLGRGYSLASANYGALFFEEASRTAAIGLSIPQFRHGPMEIVNSNFGAIVFSGGSLVRELNKKLITDITALGGKVIVITPEIGSYAGDSVIECGIPNVDYDFLPMVEILAVQQFAVPLAHSQGFEAGVFKNIGKITLTE